MWLMKVKESQQFQFFASYAIDMDRLGVKVGGESCVKGRNEYLIK